MQNVLQIMTAFDSYLWTKTTTKQKEQEAMLRKLPGELYYCFAPYRVYVTLANRPPNKLTPVINDCSLGSPELGTSSALVSIHTYMASTNNIDNVPPPLFQIGQFIMRK